MSTTAQEDTSIANSWGVNGQAPSRGVKLVANGRRLSNMTVLECMEYFCIYVSPTHNTGINIHYSVNISRWRATLDKKKGNSQVIFFFSEIGFSGFTSAQTLFQFLLVNLHLLPVWNSYFFYNSSKPKTVFMWTLAMFRLGRQFFPTF